MILVELMTAANKIVTLADNGVLAIKKDSEICFGKLDSEQATMLAFALIQWASQQSAEPEYVAPDPRAKSVNNNSKGIIS